MKPEAQRIAIAEACGWKKCRYVEGLRDVIGEPPAKWKGYYAPGQEVAWAPDYLGDLNAMHEAEKMLTEIQCAFYRQNLHEIITDIPASRYVWHATAAQRAEAFLRTLNRWTDDT